MTRPADRNTPGLWDPPAGSARSGQTPSGAPLAERMRPRCIAEFTGQEHLLGEGRILRRMIETDSLSSLIFWGPPGCGKTTLAHVIAAETRSHFIFFSAILSGIKEIREIFREAEGYAARAVDIDIIYINGYGFPAYRGGPMWYADTVGLKKVYDRITGFQRIHGELWEPAPLLKKLAAEGRTFADFEDYWTTSLLGSAIGPTVAGMPAEEAARLKARVRARLPADASGRISCSGRANAVKGRVPA